MTSHRSLGRRRHQQRDLPAPGRASQSPIDCGDGQFQARSEVEVHRVKALDMISLGEERDSVYTVVGQFRMDAQIGKMRKSRLELGLAEPCMTVAPFADQSCGDLDVEDCGYDAHRIFLCEQDGNGSRIPSCCRRVAQEPSQSDAGVEYEALSQDAFARQKELPARSLPRPVRAWP